jgi:hypothetical protein
MGLFKEADMIFMRVVTIFYLSAFLFSCYAHIDTTSLSIKGGEIFSAGEKVQITWKIAVFHNRPHIIYFSPGTGQPWQKIDSLPEKQGVMNMSYTWTVPFVATQTARIRIFQSYVPSPGEKTNDYTIISNPFTISTAATRVIADNSGPTVRRHTGFVGNAFDLNGRVVDNRFNGRMAGRVGLFRKIVR